MHTDRTRLRMGRRDPAAIHKPAIPLHLTIRPGVEVCPGEGIPEHEVGLAVINAPDAVVQSHADADPRVVRYLQRGRFDLSQEVLDWVMSIAFNRLIYEVGKLHGASAAEVWVADGTEWLGRRLAPAHAEAASAALAPHVKRGPGVWVHDLAWVRRE